MKDIILYHGSRGGLDGEIQPASRAKCDFGRAFYLGTREDQVKRLVAFDSDPYFYVINLRLSEMDPSKILRLDGRDWALYIAQKRGYMEQFRNTELYKRVEQLDHGKKIVCGKIADDRMAESMKLFFSNQITDRNFLERLRTLTLGDQYALKTPHACRLAEIITSRPISLEEAMEARELEKQALSTVTSKINNIHRVYFRTGDLFDEMCRKIDLQINQKLREIELEKTAELDDDFDL